MKPILPFLALLGAGMTLPALAQSSTPATPPAAAATPNVTPNAPPGADGFTEGQARSRMEAAGYTSLTELRRDDAGVWRARGMRGGQPAGVALDDRGNIAAR